MNKPVSTARTFSLPRIASYLLVGLSCATLGNACVSDAVASPPDADASLAQRVAQLEAREEIRDTLLAFAEVVDSGDSSRLADVAPRLADDFVMDAIDFDGSTHHFEGVDGVIEEFGPIMDEAQANLTPSAIRVHIEGDTAEASFKFTNSVKPPPQLALDVDTKVLLLSANTATFRYEDGDWKLTSLELTHSLAYPGSL